MAPHALRSQQDLTDTAIRVPRWAAHTIRQQDDTGAVICASLHIGCKGERGGGKEEGKHGKGNQGKKQKGKEESPTKTHQTTQPSQRATVLSI